MKWGILATGNIAKKFASTINQMSKENEQLVAVGSRNIESAKAFANEHNIPRYYDSYEALVKDQDVEAVYVATPNTLHYENCRLCLEHGKHVLCEKPFTINDKQAQELYRLARDRHLFIMEGLWIWFLPLYDRLRSILQQGVIGEIKHISCQYGFVATGARKERKFNPELGGGALLDIGIYNLGFLRIVTGDEPQNVETQKVHINEYGTDDYSCLKLTYNDGCTAESVQTIGQELKRNARIEGTKGSIFLPDFQHAETMILEVEGKEPETIECPVDINGFEYEIREVSRCVKLGYCSSDVYTAKDSIALTRMMYDIRTSWSEADMKTVIIYASVHHNNTKKIVDAIADEYGVDIIDAAKITEKDLSGYDLIGFASGIYFGKMHQAVINFAEVNLPENKEVFLMCTYGGRPVFDSIKGIIKEKQGRIVGEFSCKGYDTFGPFKLIGGISKGHPDKNDLDNAKAFFKGLCKNRN